MALGVVVGAIAGPSDRLSSIIMMLVVVTLTSIFKAVVKLLSVFYIYYNYSLLK